MHPNSRPIGKRCKCHYDDSWPREEDYPPILAKSCHESVAIIAPIPNTHHCTLPTHLHFPMSLTVIDISPLQRRPRPCRLVPLAVSTSRCYHNSPNLSSFPALDCGSRATYSSLFHVISLRIQISILVP